MGEEIQRWGQGVEDKKYKVKPQEDLLLWKQTAK